MINGCKLIVLSSKTRHSGHRRRFFFGGLILIVVSVLTLFVSVIYNGAIATSNSELIFNAVIILFLTDLDELVYDIVMAINPHWVSEQEEDVDDSNETQMEAKLKKVENNNSEIKRKNLQLEEELGNVKAEVADLRGKFELMQSHITGTTS